MRDLQKRLRALEDKRSAADAGPIPTLSDFYAAIHDPEHPRHKDTNLSLAHFYGGVLPTVRNREALI